jgi:hypothetical protein
VHVWFIHLQALRQHKPTQAKMIQEHPATIAVVTAQGHGDQLWSIAAASLVVVALAMRAITMVYRPNRVEIALSSDNHEDDAIISA